MSTQGSSVGPPSTQQALAGLVGALTGGADVVELLELVTGRCLELLVVDAAAVVVDDGREALQLLAASPATVHPLEVLQDHPADGPCHDCQRTGRPVRVQDLADHARRWPAFAPPALRAGFTRVLAVPVRAGSRTVGALALLGGRTGTWTDDDLELAQAVADVAGRALTRASRGVDQLPLHLHAALDDRATVEQAAGVLAQTGGLDVARAHAALRRCARDRELRLTDVARAVATRAVQASDVLDAGASSVAQLEANLQALTGPDLTADEIAAIEPHAAQPGSSP